MSTLTIPGLVHTKTDGTVFTFSFDAAAYELAVVGLEASYYVRGGMGCTSVEDLNEVVREALRTTKLMPRDRARLAVAALRGWVTHNAEEAEPLTWYRLLGDTRLEVVAS